jgi:response regulator of citrate/malate metabolism
MRNYKRYYDFRGSFLEYLPKVIDEEAYEVKKDDAIMNFKKEAPKVADAAKKKIEMHTEGKLIDRLSKNMKEITQKELAKLIEIPLTTLQKRLRDYRSDNSPSEDPHY